MSWQKVLTDGGWAEKQTGVRGRIALVTFGILALELGLIRWTSSQVRVFAYFNNVLLICAFLGMGLGVSLGRRWPGLVHLVLPLLLVLALPLAFSEPLGLVRMPFPDHTIALWGGDVIKADVWIVARNLAIFCGLLALVIAIFVCAGAPLGVLFTRRPILQAYTADLAGSLIGIISFTLLAWGESGPAWWLAVGGLPFVVLTRRAWSALLLVAVVALGYYTGIGVFFSPYNRIELLTGDPLGIELQVNRDYHQHMFDLSDRRIDTDTERRGVLVALRRLYDLPFTINAQRGSALVVGAGTGNDVQAALRHGYGHVTSVDIDGHIIAVGRAQHPERPYSSPKVTPVVNDARAFFGQDRETKFDAVCYGLLDSHAMSSAMSTLRLDNYVYTEQGIRAAWQHVAPRGHLSLALSCTAGQWFMDRLYWTITKATGHEPIALYSPLHGGAITFIVPESEAVLDHVQIGDRQRMFPRGSMNETLTTNDDWPFLYLRPGIFPWGYLVVLGFVLAITVLAVRPVFGVGRGGAGFDWVLFLMGAAFLLIETRGVTSLSLLFGSTWVVNSAVFGGILTMVLAANLVVQRWQLQNPLPWFVVLFGAVLLLWWFPLEWLNQLPLVGRGLAGGLLTGLPIGIAGLIVPMLLARAAQPAAALGANLLGAVLGGSLEYFSMLGGLKSMALMALVLYLVAFLVLRARARPPASAA
ncbi:MAG TPA: class I SAM-dependent methyltransferase [Candidatus Didemnitutus sp.]|nr:class I SAM-dependent methyltransferase [Candidatus Didemnitutus sp.]